MASHKPHGVTGHTEYLPFIFFDFGNLSRQGDQTGVETCPGSISTLQTGLQELFACLPGAEFQLP